jgi:hypothetical protein
MLPTFKALQSPAPTSRGRIRLSNAMIQGLGWKSVASTFDCYAFFRGRQELLCAPLNLTSEPESHPFGHVARIVEAVQNPVPVFSLRDIPSPRQLVASERLLMFKASWTSEDHKQLDLNLGVEITDRLGWSINPTQARPIYVGVYANIFIAMSEERYIRAQEEDLGV